jgi:hypothetical protein
VRTLLLLLQHLQLQATQSLDFHLVWRGFAQWRIRGALARSTSGLAPLAVVVLALFLAHVAIGGFIIAGWCWW